MKTTFLVLVLLIQTQLSFAIERSLDKPFFECTISDTYSESSGDIEAGRMELSGDLSSPSYEIKLILKDRTERKYNGKFTVYGKGEWQQLSEAAQGYISHSVLIRPQQKVGEILVLGNGPRGSSNTITAFFVTTGNDSGIVYLALGALGAICETE